jgi:prepilin peptidase CpaA
MTYPPPAVQILLLISCLIAAIWDVRFRRIPNWLVLASLILGFALNMFLYPVLSGLLISAKGLGLAMLIYFPLYLIRAMGAGDVKLMAVIGSIAGAADWIGIFFCTAIIGGLAALLLLLYKRQVRSGFWNVGFLLSELFHFRAPYIRREVLDVKNPGALTLPHGAVIASGVITFLIAARIWAPR